MTKGLEPVTQAVLQILQAGTPAIIDKINAEYALLDPTNTFIAGNSIPLPYIEAFYFGQRLEVPVFPAIMVEPVDSAIDGERFHFHWADYDHKINVDVLVMSDNEDALTRQVLRYARAIWEVLFGNQTDQVTGGAIQAISLKPARGSMSTVAQKDNGLLKGWRWEMDVHRYDDLL